MLHKGVFRIGLYIGNMDHPSFKKGPADTRAAFGFDWRIADLIHELAREAVSLAAIKNSIFLAGDDGFIGITELCGRFNKRLQYGLQIKSRTADDLEHIGGGGLLLKGFTKLIEQARILDGNDGLGGEVFDKIDFLLAKRP